MMLHLEIVGLLLMVLALMHGLFPKYFNWKKEFSAVSMINRQMMYVHTFFIALILFLMGLLCLTSAAEIIETTLGQRIALGFGFFWFIRLLIQFFGYSIKLWKGKSFETIIHILFSLLWTYFSLVFIMIFWNGSF